MPPPPPPPAPRMPGPPAPSRLPARGAGGGGGDARGALLADIRGGARLKKAVTNDRSAPQVGTSKPSTNGGSYSSSGGGGGLASGSGMMNGGAPQLGGLFAGGMPKLKSTGRGISGSNSSGGRSAPLLPPGRKPAPSVPDRDVVGDSEQSADNISIPPSPKPSSKSSPAPPPPPASRKPNISSDRQGRGPLPDPPDPANKPLAQKPSADVISASAPSKVGHPTLPNKPNLVSKPTVGSKPAPPRPPNSAKPSLPPKLPVAQPNGSTGNRPASRANSMKEFRSSTENDYADQNDHSKEDNMLPSSMARTLPAHHHRQAPSGPNYGSASNRPVTVGRASGASITRSMSRPLPPHGRPNVPAPPPPTQPPPPPPHRPGSLSAPSKPEPPNTAPPPPPPVRVPSRPSGKHFPSQFCTLPPRLSRDTRHDVANFKATLRSHTVDVLDYNPNDEISSRYSFSQSVDCEACVLEGEEGQLQYCQDCHEKAASEENECRECQEYGMSRGAAENQSSTKEKNVSCFTACKPKTKKASHKIAKKDFKKIESEMEKHNEV